jgi:hypothetical protein
VSFERTWTQIARGLPADWEEARLAVALDHPDDAPQAASLLAPLHPLRLGSTVKLHLHRGAGTGADAVTRVVRRLDKAGIAGAIELEAVREGVPAPAADVRSLASQWDDALAALPPDWSDLLAEVALASSDHLERAALLMSPAQPTRAGRTTALRFRSARSFGYGVSSEMARRCLERVDDEEIPGELHVLRALSDTHNVSTQGPVWYVGGRTV